MQALNALPGRGLGLLFIPCPQGRPLHALGPWALVHIHTVRRTTGRALPSCQRRAPGSTRLQGPRPGHPEPGPHLLFLRTPEGSGQRAPLSPLADPSSSPLHRVPSSPRPRHLPQARQKPRIRAWAPARGYSAPGLDPGLDPGPDRRHHGPAVGPSQAAHSSGVQLVGAAPCLHRATQVMVTLHTSPQDLCTTQNTPSQPIPTSSRVQGGGR